MARNFVVTVKERGENDCFLLVESQEEIGLNADQHIILMLADNKDIDDYNRIATLINTEVSRIQVTKF